MEARADVSSAGLGAFRVLFGIVVTVSAVRFIAKGWVEEIYLAPEFHFTWAAFDFVRPWPEPWMYAHIIALAVLGVAIAFGVYARAACLLFAMLFTWAELIEKAAYLNHYYLVSLLALWLALLPSDRSFRLLPRVRRCPDKGRFDTDTEHGQREGGDATGEHSNSRSETCHNGRDVATVPHYAYWFLRAQVSLVYLFAGLAKLNADWLVRAEPLQTWLLRVSDVPLLGDALSSPAMAFAMSWGGAAFDLSIWAFMLHPRTRKSAYFVALVFHMTVGLLFPIGVFPFVMMLALTVFFAPDWPIALARRIGARWPLTFEHTRAGRPGRGRNYNRLIVALGATLLVTQLLVPFRHTLYPGPVNWTEEGYRFSWRVMLIEKTGLVEYRVTSASTDQETVVFPRENLSKLQFQMLAVNPDMIQDYAYHLRSVYQRRWNIDDVKVYVDSFVSFNGRPARRWIDPHVDLVSEPRGLGHRTWILPLDDR